MVKTKKKAIWITLILFIVLWIIYFLNRDFFQLDTLFSNLENIQKAFNHRAKMNGLSSKGEWSENLEKVSLA